jgi:hypothetical protein
MRTKLLGLLKVYEDEISLLLWTAALLFIIRSSGIILNNYAETAFLKRYGVEYLPIVTMLNSVATFFITGLLSTFMSRVPGAKLLSYVFIFSGIIITIIRLLIPTGIDLLYPLLFMLKSQFELLQALLFWNMCNDLFNTRQSKRIFPLLTAGGVIGLILGSFGTPYFAKTFQFDNLLYLYLCTTLLGVVIVQGMGRSFPTLIFPEKTGVKSKKKTTMMQEFKDVLPLIKDSTLIKIVLVLTFMPNVVLPILNYQFNYAINDQFASETSMIEFFGYFRGLLNVISLIILLFVGRIYGKWGLPVALMFHPFNYMIAFLAFLFRFDMFSAMYARMSINIIRTTINVPASSILIGLFPESYRNMIRPFLRGTVAKAASFVGSFLVLISVNLMHPRYLTLVALPFVLAWIAAPIVLKSKYAKILMDLVSKNMLDLKGLEQKELTHIFKENNIVTEMEQSFLAARGEDAIWYGKLLKNFSKESLDKNILKTLQYQDDETKVVLIKMLSTEFKENSIQELIPALDPEKPEVTIAIFKIISQYEFDLGKDMDFQAYVNNSHPVVRGFAVACLYNRNPDQYKKMVAGWLSTNNIKERQSGIICVGLTRNREYIDILLAILKEDEITPIIPDIIIALSRLRAKELNTVIYSYLTYERPDVRMAALDALELNDDFSLEKAINLLGDRSDAIHKFAKEKIKTSEFQNNKLLVKSLGTPDNRTRRGVFELLETLDIKEFDIFMFARENLNKCYFYLAMSENLKNWPDSRIKNLTMEHMVQQKELGLENVIRVLAIHDHTGKMKTAWRGIFSPDTKQRANAIELLSDIMDKKLFNIMLPLLESPTPAVAIADGKNVAKIPKFDPEGKDVFANLITSEDWVDVLMGLGLANDDPSFFEGNDILNDLQNSFNHNILKEVQMILKKTDESKDPQRIKSTEISLGEKILLLKEIDMFAGLTPAELAAIAAVTKELDYPEDRTVIQQGKFGETVFLIINGQVEVIKELADGGELFLDKIESGDSFGEMALLENEPRSATVRTTKVSRFLILHQQEFNETVMEYPRIALKICKVLSSRIRHLHVKIQAK